MPPLIHREKTFRLRGSDAPGLRHSLGTCLRRVALYLLAVFVTHVLLIFWRERFYVRSIYAFNQSTFAILKFLTALEIWSRTFSTSPGAGLA